VAWILVLRADLYPADSCAGSQRTRRQRTVEVIPYEIKSCLGATPDITRVPK
jgi:hypothetical protein